MASYDCSICKRRVAYDGPLPRLFPFCSERCRMVDLGNWFRGEYFVEGEAADGGVADSDYRGGTEDSDA